ncbi:MAG: hypothetical protein ABW039_01175 [Sphingobium sp.]
MRKNILRAALAGAAIVIAMPAAAQQGEIKDGAADYGKVLTYLDLQDNSGIASPDPILYRETLTAPSIELPHIAWNVIQSRYASYFNQTLPGGAPRYAIGYFASDSNINGAVLQGDYWESQQDGSFDAYQDPSGPNYFVFRAAIPCMSVDTPDPDEREGFDEGIGSGYDDTYGVQFAGDTPTQAYNRYLQYLAGAPIDDAVTFFDGQTVRTADQFRTSLYGCSVSQAAVNPLVGNSRSLQFDMAASGLDLAQTPSLDLNDDLWGVGLRVGRVSEAGNWGTQYDANISKSWRLSEGSRARILLDVPVTIEDFRSVTRYRGYASLGLHYPISSSWALEPRVAYGFVDAKQNRIDGQMFNASLASRLTFGNLLGRGVMTIGNMIGWTKVTRIEFDGKKIDANTSNAVFRNGAAYELPLNGRLMGRAASVRGSYVHTYFTGDKLYAKSLHEGSVSLGIRSREDSARNSHEVMRIGAMGRIGSDYKSWHVFFGYRF